MNIIQNPPEICNAYNDIIVVFEKEEGDTVAELVVKYLNDEPEEEVYTLRREFLTVGGSEIAKFNLSYLVKKLFRNRIRDTFNGSLPRVYVDEMIYNQPFITGYEDGNITCLNSVRQSGSPFLIAENNIFLSKVTRLKKYKGYPLSVSFLKNSPSSFGYLFYNNVVFESRDTLSVPYYFSANNHISIIVGDSTNMLSFKTTSSPQDQTDKVIYVDHPCTPPADNALYLRWIDGGDWQYYMFDRRHIVSRSIAEGDTFIANESTETTILVNEKRLNIKANATIETGADQLTTEYYNLLSAIPFSPVIQMYDLANNQWIDIIPDGANANSFNSASPMQSIRLSFKIPQITQF